MERWAGKVVVISGASAGIGLATAKILVQNGMTVVGLARRKEKMEKEMADVKGPGKFHPKKCDITKEQDVAEVFAWIKKNFGTVNILINNAGMEIQKPIEAASVEELQKVLDLNVMGVLICTKQAINLMKTSYQESLIININSVAGHKVLDIAPHRSNIYPATKFALKAISEICRNELREYKIRTSNISPGYTKTEFHTGFDMTALSTFPALQADDVANSILHVISAPPHVNITELTIQASGEKF